MDFNKALSNAEWIWADCIQDVNQYCELRCDFMAEASTATLFISADWNCVAYLNGLEVMRGQFTDYPWKKTVTEIRLDSLRNGKNSIAISAYAPGKNFSAKMKGTPGVLAAIVQNEEIICQSSSSNWKARLHTAYASGQNSIITPELGFSVQYDARKQENISLPEYNDSNWSAAVSAPRECSLEPRPLPPLPSGDALPARCVASGWLLRNYNDVSGTYGDQVMRDDYSAVADAANGQWSVWDLQVESTGFALLDITAPEDGVTADFSWGEDLKDGHVRAKIGNRTFTFRIICAKGRQRIELPFDRLGCRYVQINLTGSAAKACTIHYAGLQDCTLPLPSATHFTADIPYANTLREIGLRTLHCCMHDHYEDCPWREQSLYGYDSRNQMLYGYYAWGNYQFARASLALLGDGYVPHLGELNECAPNAFADPCPEAATIPSFTRAWVAAMREYALYSGDLSLARQFAPTLKQMFRRFMEDFDVDNGLFRLSDSINVWNFFGWTAGLFKPREVRHHLCGWHLLHNLYTLEALRAVSWLFNELGDIDEAQRWSEVASKLPARINAVFYLPNEQRYATFVKDGTPLPLRHTQSQFLPIALDVASPEVATQLRQAVLEDKTLLGGTFSPLPYYMKAMFKADSSSEHSQAAIQWMDKLFLSMAQQGATSFWETPDGAAAFGNAGSLCHGWSSAHVGFYGEYLLGVRPTRPGFREFTVTPYAPNGCKFAEGLVPTPYGPITVAWEADGNGIPHLTKVDAPNDCKLAKY